MIKGKEYTAKRYGWDIVVRKTKKGWIIDIQSHLGWKQYYLPNNQAEGIKETPDERQVRLLGVFAQWDGKRLGIPKNRGLLTTIKDAFGYDMVVKI